jgi:hypothetical protein
MQVSENGLSGEAATVVRYTNKTGNACAFPSRLTPRFPQRQRPYPLPRAVDQHAVRIACGVLVEPNRLTFVVDPVQQRTSDSVGIIECVRVALDGS